MNEIRQIVGKTETDVLIKWPTEWKIDRTTERPTDQLTDWPTNTLTKQTNKKAKII